MLLLKSILLLIAIFNIAIATVSPGPIDHSQYSDIPSVLYYGGHLLNGIQPINQQGCIKPITVNVGKSFIPIVILNETSYLSYAYNGDYTIDISIISDQGVIPLYVDGVLNDFFKSNKILHLDIFYDDRLQLFVLLLDNGSIATFDYLKNKVKVLNTNKGCSPFPNPYYELETSTLYAGFSCQGGLSYMKYPLDVTEFIYYINDLNLEYPLDSYQIGGYNGTIVIFGNNNLASKSVLYLVHPAVYTIAAERDYGYTLIAGANSRYVVLMSQDGSTTELFDLETLKSQVFQNTCTQSFYTSAMVSSIADKSIFTN